MDNSGKTLFTGILLALSLFIVAWVNVQQSWFYHQKRQIILQLETRENEIYQQNKRLFALISELESPAHILRLMRNNPGWNLHYIAPSEVVLIYPASVKESMR
ncbi:MAG: hypothetical protein ACRCVN_03515 [Spirochaetia bacterium]